MTTTGPTNRNSPAVSSEHPPDLARFFDVDHYLAQIPDSAPARDDALSHYLEVGWRSGYDPSPVFSTRGYLLVNPDVKEAGINPLVHYLACGRHEGRLAQPDTRGLDGYFDPDYYRSRFREPVPYDDDGLQHYLTRGWRDGRNPSPGFYTDGYLYMYPDVAASGMNPLLHFARHGMAEGRRAYPVDAVRVFDSSRFLVSVVLDARRGEGFLLDSLRALGNQTHGKIETVILRPHDSPAGHEAMRRAIDGGSLSTRVVSGHEMAAPPWVDWHRGIEAAAGDLVWIGWNERETEALAHERLVQDLARSFEDPSVTAALDVDPLHEDGGGAAILPSCAWFSGEQAGRRLSEASGVLFRRQPPGKGPWRDADAFNAAKLRFLYEVSNGGQIATVARGKSTHPAGIGAGTTMDAAAVSTRVSGWRSPHVLIGFRGFHIGGAEIFPIHLANALLDQGFRVSMLSTQPEDEWPALRADLDPRIAVYDTNLPLKVGFDVFPGYAGIDLVSSHCPSVEDFFLSVEGRFTGIPYVASLHGHYQTGRVEQGALRRLLRSVTHWVYTTDRNLRIFDGLPLDPARVSYIPNGMPRDPRPFPRSRESLGIGPGDLVFTLVARPVAGKGWAEAIQAVLLAQQRAARRLVLLLCGDGPEAAEMRQRYAGNPDIVFIGTQDRIHGLYAISDCALLPSRFTGESFPLCLIQAMQAGTPVIATAVSEIPRMTRDETLSAGPLLDAEGNADSFVEQLAGLIVEMSDDHYRRARSADAAVLGERLDIGYCAKAYAALYESLLGGYLPPGRGDNHPARA